MKKKIPLRQRLFVVVVAAVLPLALMAGLALYAGYQDQRRQAERAGLDIARAFSSAITAELRRTASVLAVLGTTRALDPLDLALLRERARQTKAAEPSWHAITLTAPDGRTLLHSEVEPDAPLAALLDRASFDRVVAQRVPSVGSLVRDASGAYVFPVRVPIVRGNEVSYVLSALVKPRAILDVVNSVPVRGDWVVAVADGNGLRVARTRSAEQTLGTPYSPSLVEMMRSGGDEGTGVTHNSEGDAVFTAYTRLPLDRWSVAVGQPTVAIDAAARASFVTLGAGVALSLLLGVIAALFIARRISRPISDLRQSAIAMGRGEPYVQPEVDLREVHDVAETLAAAAREQAQARAEREEFLHREQAARAEAESANRAKDELLAMLGHELRNPLAALSNAASVLATPHLDEERARRTRAIIARQVGHLARLTDDLLDAGRAILGKIVLQTRPLDLSAAAMQSLLTLKSAGRLERHRVVEDFQPAWADADPVRVDQIVSNLVVNAVKYTPAGGTIRVTVRAEDGFATLRVADDGAGIEPDLLPRVFDLFVQGARDLDRSQGGLGIGLTLVRRLAELHGGGAVAMSEGVGRGSEFVVRLPAREAEAPAAPGEPAAPAAAARTILVIEDNADARDTLRFMLEAYGHSVETAADGPAGLEKALALQPEVALIDVGLPTMNGYEVARRIRARPGIRRPFLVALTGYGSPEDRRRALEAGFDRHMVKPVEGAALEEMLASVEAAPQQ